MSKGGERWRQRDQQEITAVVQAKEERWVDSRWEDVGSGMEVKESPEDLLMGWMWGREREESRGTPGLGPTREMVPFFEVDKTGKTWACSGGNPSFC